MRVSKMKGLFHKKVLLQIANTIYKYISNIYKFGQLSYSWNS